MDKNGVILGTCRRDFLFRVLLQYWRFLMIPAWHFEAASQLDAGNIAALFRCTPNHLCKIKEWLFAYLVSFCLYAWAKIYSCELVRCTHV